MPEPACICPPINATSIEDTELRTIPGWNPGCTLHPVLWAGEPAHVRTPRLCRYDERTADANYLAAIRVGNTRTSPPPVEQTDPAAEEEALRP